MKTKKTSKTNAITRILFFAITLTYNLFLGLYLKDFLVLSERSMTVTYNASYTLPTPARDEYTFVGWYNGETKYSGGTWSIASNVSLTAKWTSNFT